LKLPVFIAMPAMRNLKISGLQGEYISGLHSKLEMHILDGVELSDISEKPGIKNGTRRQEDFCYGCGREKRLALLSAGIRMPP